MKTQVEMKWQVFVVRDRSDHTVWQYDTLEEAEEQYDLIDPRADRKELQQVLVLKKDRRKGESIFKKR